MCEKQDRINELEKELQEQQDSHRQKVAELWDSHSKREADLFKTLAEGRNFESQCKWRPWQIVAIPMLLGIVSIVIAVFTAVVK